MPGSMEEPEKLQVVFPPSLSSRQRAVIHELAEEAGLLHKSSGETGCRFLRLGPADGQKLEVSLRIYSAILHLDPEGPFTEVLLLL